MLEDKISSRACTLKCPAYDYVQYFISVMSACMMSYALNQGRLMDWSWCSAELAFGGGVILKPDFHLENMDATDRNLRTGMLSQVCNVGTEPRSIGSGAF